MCIHVLADSTITMLMQSQSGITHNMLLLQYGRAKRCACTTCKQTRKLCNTVNISASTWNHMGVGNSLSRNTAQCVLVVIWCKRINARETSITTCVNPMLSRQLIPTLANAGAARNMCCLESCIHIAGDFRMACQHTPKSVIWSRINTVICKFKFVMDINVSVCTTFVQLIQPQHYFSLWRIVDVVQ